MFSALFEVQPRKDEWDVYLSRAKMRRTELEQVPGFIDSILYRSFTRDGWILSLSNWRHEDALLNFHARMPEFDPCSKHILPDFRLRTGEVTSDSTAFEGQNVAGRQDDTDVTDGNYVTLIAAKQTLDWVSANNPQEMAIFLGFDLNSSGDCISWDLYESLANPGEILLVVTWKNAQSANDHVATQIVPEGARVRVIRVTRDHASSGPGNSQSDPDAVAQKMVGV